MGLVTGGADLDLDRRYTIADLEFLPEDGRKYELADGWLIVSPTARRMHQLACMRIGQVLQTACPADLFVFALPINVDYPDQTHFEPDVSVVRKKFATVENGDVPILVVEVRSASAAGRDAVLKSAAYASLGIRSYWLVDVHVPSIRVLELRAGAYAEMAYVENDAVIEVERPFPVRLVPRLLVTVD